jgi:amidase
VRAAVVEAARLLASAGHQVEEADAPHGDVDDFLPIWQHLFGQISLVKWHRAEPVTRWLGESGKGIQVAAVRKRQAELTERWAGWLDGCDVLLTPTVSIPPPKVGSFATEDGEAMFRAVASLGVWTAPFNVTGQPALTVPVGLDPDLGTPIGAQLAGPMGSEATLLALAARVEEGLALTKRPRVWAGPR